MERESRPGRVDVNSLSLPEAYSALSRGGLVRRLLLLAREEDLGPDEPLGVVAGDGLRGRRGRGVGDVTTAACVSPDRRVVAAVVARQGGVAAGLEAVGDVVDVFAPGVEHEPAVRDGSRFNVGDVLCVLRGPLDEILEVERTLLNVIGRLSGIATLTAEYVRAMGSETRARVYDTRKTTPGLRMLEKYAVRCGGGFCHRLGLHDAMLIKDNHVAGVSVEELPGFVSKAASEARRLAGDSLAFVEVEAETFAQFQALLTLPEGVVDVVLLDNFWPQSQDGYTIRDASAMRDLLCPRMLLEASGGVRLENVRDIALAGVDRISVGALTHQARSVDVALNIVEAGRVSGHRGTATGEGVDVETANGEDVSIWASVLESDLREEGKGLVDRARVMGLVESTQDAAEVASDGIPGLMLVAGRQRGGRGRLGRAWSDGEGRGLAVTFVLGAGDHDVGRVSIAAGVAAAMACERTLPAAGPRSGRRRIGIRWPNDIVDRTSGRKLAGVLIEKRGGLLLVGIGINVLQRDSDWPHGLRASAMSLAECGSVVGRLNVARLLRASLEDAIGLDVDRLVEAWTKRDVLIGSDATFVIDGHEVTGRVMAIEPTLELIVRTAEGERCRLPAATTTLVRAGGPG